MSSAILYVAIVAIWAGVLIPRWLRKDSPSTERAIDDLTVPTETPTAEEQPGPPRRLPEGDVHRARSKIPEARPGAPGARPEGARPEGARPEGARPEARPVSRPEPRSEVRPDARPDVRPEPRPEDSSRDVVRDEEHARVLSARRRLLGMLVVLTIGSAALAITRTAAWWVVLPPTVMLLGYMTLLREAAKADAERRELMRTRAAATAAKPAEPAVPVAPAAPPAPVPDAEIIDISASKGSAATAGSAGSAVQGDEEFYDQYADAKLRAVGDLRATG